MTRLYIANLTNQRLEFNYRLAGELNYRQEDIGVGRQALLPGELTSDAIAYIIKQHEPYNMRDAKELKNVKDYVGRCYSIDTPVQAGTLIMAFEHNRETLNEIAIDRRETEAASIAGGISEAMQNIGVNVPHTEVEFVDASEKGRSGIAEGYEITANGAGTRHRNSRESKRANKGSGHR